jgi:hypothetical protein
MVKMRIGSIGLPAVVLGSLALACSSQTSYVSAAGGQGSAGGTLGMAGETGQAGGCICDYKPDRDAGSGGATGTGAGDASDASGLQVCQWPAALDPSDASASGACRAARALVKCSDVTGGGRICLSDDPATCPDAPSPPETTTCQSQCAANEYAASCGSIGPSTRPRSESDPPVGCHMAMATPGGIAFYCCPCLAR